MLQNYTNYYTMYMRINLPNVRLSYIILQPTAYPPHFPHTSTTCPRIETLFDYREGDVQLALCDLHSLVDIPDQLQTIICAHHPSLGEWLFTPARSEIFYVNRSHAHGSIAKRLMHHLPRNAGTYTVPV